MMLAVVPRLVQPLLLSWRTRGWSAGAERAEQARTTVRERSTHWSKGPPDESSLERRYWSGGSTAS
jgi:hypothetical protein